MPPTKIEKLSLEQEALIPIYREKWRTLVFQNKPIHRQQARKAVKAAYATIGKKEPTVIFFDSPEAVWEKLWNQLDSNLQRQLARQLGAKLRRQLGAKLRNKLEKQINSQLDNQLSSELRRKLKNQIKGTLHRELKQVIDKSIQTEIWACDASWFDFCISVLNCQHDKQTWKAFQSLILSCGWIFPYEKTCIICDRAVNELTPEQEALIPIYREKWRSIGIATGPIDRCKAAETVKAVYAAIGKQEPYLLFFDSPYAALNAVLRQQSSQVSDELSRELDWHLYGQLSRQMYSKVWDRLNSQLWYELRSQMCGEIGRNVESQIERQARQQWNYPDSPFARCIRPEELACDGSRFDFCISVLNCQYDRGKWELFQLLVKHCGCIFPFEEIAIICDKPIKLSFDKENRLHAEGEPAIQYADGFSVDSYHGSRLPERYSKLHPNQWRSEWILEENNAEVRRLLIQRIGYDRICQELQATELDSWQEYTLLKIDIDMELDDKNQSYLVEEKIYLLKMICPSTGFVRALRVPPNMKSARDAIRWVNWGIDPEEFSVQT